MKLLKPCHNLFKALVVLVFLGSASMSYGQLRRVDNLQLEQNDSLNVILKQLNSGSFPGKVNVIPHDERILDLLWRHVNYNDSIGIYGWKVLIYNGRSRAAASDAESLFLNSFPDIQVPTKVIYPEPPDFKTVVGVFRTKEEAFKLQQKIKSVFKYSYLVNVRLEKGELN